MIHKRDSLSGTTFTPLKRSASGNVRWVLLRVLAYARQAGISIPVGAGTAQPSSAGPKTGRGRRVAASLQDCVGIAGHLPAVHQLALWLRVAMHHVWSGRGCGDWSQTATFILAAQVFDLRSWRNRDGRDELVVSVPLDWVPQIVRLIDRIGEEPESWPWIYEDDRDRQISVADEVLGITAATVSDDADMLVALRIE